MNDELCGVDCGGETQALSREDNGGVDANHFTARIDQRAAGVARIERGVGLNHVVDKPTGLRTQ